MMEGATTTTQREPYPFVTKVVDLFGDWLKQRRELKELMEFAADPGELERVARELNVTPADLAQCRERVRQLIRGLRILPHREPYPFVTKVVDLFGDWLKQRRELRELMEFAADPGELERVARELNVTPADLAQCRERVRQLIRGLRALPHRHLAID
jgi:uncharacterized protein YjiS (DUF1127 family)